LTDFLTGVLAGILLYGLLFKFFDPPHPLRTATSDVETPTLQRDAEQRNLDVEAAAVGN
jgi:hypothetical protein